MCVFPTTFQFKWSEFSPLTSKSLSKFTKMENCFAIPSGGKSFASIDSSSNSSFVMSVEKLHFEAILFNGIFFPFPEHFFQIFFFFKTEKQFSIFVNFDNDLEESGEISDAQFY